MTQTGSAIDWPAMLETHKPWLAKVLRCRVSDTHAIEDLYQEIALAVVRQRDTDAVPDKPEKVAPWLYRLAVRQAVNFHRSNNRQSHAKPMDLSDQSAAAIHSLKTEPSPYEKIAAAEQQQQFHAALEKLTPAQREILTLKYTENWSYQQLSDHLGIPVRSVEYRLLVARNELRTMLEY